MLGKFTKGLGAPLLREGVTVEEVGQQGWNLLAEDLPLPVAVVRQQALTNNSCWMREFVGRTGTKLAPHGKTTMSPQLFAMQMADGAWGLTLATIQQVRVARGAGVKRILLANELVGRSDLAYVLDELQRDPSFDFYCLVDSLDGARRLIDAATARGIGRPLNLLIEIGYSGGRAGCRDVETALAIARALNAAEPHVALRGVEGFEGLYQSLPAAEGERRVREFLQRMVATAERIDAEGLFRTGRSSREASSSRDGSSSREASSSCAESSSQAESLLPAGGAARSGGETSDNEIILSAGGSAFYDLVVEMLGGARVRDPARLSVVLRSGCYLTHDTGIYERSFREVTQRSELVQHIQGRLENALEVWAYVISVPESGRAILGAGRRDFGHDGGMPTPIKHFRPGRDSHPVILAAATGAVATAASAAGAGATSASAASVSGADAGLGGSAGSSAGGAGGSSSAGARGGDARASRSSGGAAGAAGAGLVGGPVGGDGARGGDGRSAVSWEVVAVNDQHAHLLLPPGADVRVGDLIGLGVSHPCTTFDKWQLLYVVDEDYRVCSAIETFF